MLLTALQIPDNFPEYQKYYRHVHKVRMGTPPKPKAQLSSVPLRGAFGCFSSFSFCRYLVSGTSLSPEAAYTSVAMLQGHSGI